MTSRQASALGLKLVIARRFRELGLPLTVLRPMAFMELMTDKGYYPQFSTAPDAKADGPDPAAGLAVR